MIELYDKNGYINFQTPANSGCPFNWLIGGRGIGKTYGGLKFLSVDNNFPFIYMRRTQRQIELSCLPSTMPFKKINEDFGRKIKPKTEKDFITFHENGIKTAVATYKRQDYAEKILKHFGFDKVCDVICGSDFEGKLTKKDIIKNAMDSLGIVDRKRAVMVGDSDNDAQGADELGIPFIGVTYGFGFDDKADVDMFPNVGCASTCEEIAGCVI